MGMVAILVMWPGSFEQTFFPQSQQGSTWNLILTGPVVSEENVDGWQMTAVLEKGQQMTLTPVIWYTCIFMYSLFILTFIS